MVSVSGWSEDSFNNSLTEENLSIVQNVSCYQETANVSTCAESFNTGSYSFDGASWLNQNLLYDGNWFTSTGTSAISPPTAIMYVNYSLPIIADRSITRWIFRDGFSPDISTITKVEIPSLCWWNIGDGAYFKKIRLKIESGRSGSVPSSFIGYCYEDGAVPSWTNIISGASPPEYIFEEGMDWGYNYSRVRYLYVPENTFLTNAYLDITGINDTSYTKDITFEYENNSLLNPENCFNDYDTSCYPDYAETGYFVYNYTTPLNMNNATYTFKYRRNPQSFFINVSCYNSTAYESLYLDTSTGAYLNITESVDIPASCFVSNENSIKVEILSGTEAYTYFYGGNISYNSNSSPLNPYLEIPTEPFLYGNDYEWNYTGNYTGTNRTDNLANEINSIILDLEIGDNCQSISNHPFCAENGYYIPFYFHTDSIGTLEYSSMSFNNSGFIENSQTYNNETYETSYETFNLNMSFDSNIYSPNVYFVYDNTNYLATSDDTGNTRTYTKTISIPNVNTITNKTFYWNVQGLDSTYNSTILNQTVNPINFSLCDAVNNITFLSFDFQDELTLNSINATIRTSSFEYYLDDSSLKKTYNYVTASNFSQYDFCFSPSNKIVNVDTSISYYGDGYPERTYGNLLNLTNSTTNITLNLLDDGSGLYATFKFIDSVTDVGLSDVDVKIYDGTTLIISKITDSSGIVSEWLNPNILYDIQYSKSGYESDSQSIRPTSTDTYFIEMSSTAITSLPSLTNGLITEIYPTISNLDSNTSYYFGFYASEGDQAILTMNFSLYDNDDILVYSSSVQVGQGNMSQVLINTSNYKVFNGEYQICGIDGDCITYYKTFDIAIFQSNKYSLDYWGLSFDSYFPTSSRTTLTRLVWFVLWFIMMLGGFAFGYNGSFSTKEDKEQNVISSARGNTTNGLVFAFIITMVFSYFNLIPMPLNFIQDTNFLGISGDWIIQNFIAVLILMVLVWDVISSIYKHSRRGN